MRIFGKEIPPAEPPVNVHILHDDGSRSPLDCAYVGWDGTFHVWQVITELLIDPDTDLLGVDNMPAHTRVLLIAEADCDCEEEHGD